MYKQALCLPSSYSLSPKQQMIIINFLKNKFR